jgi:hypothetical protein
MENPPSGKTFLVDWQRSLLGSGSATLDKDGYFVRVPDVSYREAKAALL